MKKVTIEGTGENRNVVITETIPREPEVVKREIPYATIASHIANIDKSIAILEGEKDEYQGYLTAADKIK